MQADLTGKVALVTGSTDGIGKAIAIKLAANGADIVLNGRNPASAAEVTEQIRKLGRTVIFEKGDVTDYQQMIDAVNNALAKLRKIDILVASGGVTGRGFAPEFFERTEPDAYVSFAKSVWLSRLYCVKAVLKHMVDRKTGKIIMITTDAGRWPTPVECLPGASGAAVIMSTKVLAQELARWGIRVNAISLTAIQNTPSFDYTTKLSGSLAHIFEKALAKQPFPVTADDVAEVALFFASDESNAITGQILSVNGGLSFPG